LVERGTVSERAERLADALNRCAMIVEQELPSLPLKREKDWFDKAIYRQKEREARRLWVRYAEDPTLERRRQYRVAERAVRRWMRRAGNDFCHRQAKVYNDLWQSGQWRAFYGKLKEEPYEKQGGQSRSPPIRNGEGEMVTELEEQLPLWQGHFKTVLNPPLELGDLDLACVAGEEEGRLRADAMLSAVPNLEEVTATVELLGKNKAAGPDGLPKEMWELSKDAVYSLFCLIRDSWRGGEVPQSWKNAHITVLFKKGDRANCDNYRGIALLDHAGKVMAKIIAVRLAEYCERVGCLPEAQCGFRRGRGTRDMVFVARLLQEEAKRQGVPLYWCFVDLMKAYDTVPREGMWLVLERFGVPEGLIKVIRSFHDGMEAAVKLNGVLSGRFAVLQGLRQGCVMSPVLFNMYFAALISEVEKRFSQWKAARVRAGGSGGVIEVSYRLEVDPLRPFLGGLYCENAGIQELWKLLFADDAALVTLDAEALQALVDCFYSVALKFGLKVSLSKTKTMLQPGRVVRVGRVEQPVVVSPLRITLGPGGCVLEQVSSFVHLGSKMSSDGAAHPEVSRRTGLAMVAFRRFQRQFFRIAGVSHRAKVVVFNAMVMSVLLHGAENWTVSAAHLRSLESFHYGCLLQIVGKRRRDHVAYVDLLEQLGTWSVEGWVRFKRLLWIGKVLRMENGRLPKRVCRVGCLAAIGSAVVGRQPSSFFGGVSQDLTAFYLKDVPVGHPTPEPEDWWVVARDEGAWLAAVNQGWAAFERNWRETRIAARAQRHQAAEGGVA
jgi:hypothetical protein